MATPDMALLAGRIQAGDRAADEELVLRFHEKVFVMALVGTRDRETARDVAQQTMLVVLKAVREGRVLEPERLAGYVCGTARNLVREHVRERKVGEVPVPAEMPSASNTEEEAQEGERRFLVHRVLRKLGASDRLVLLLTLVDGLTPGEIAARLGVKPDAVRQRKLRAIQRARMLLERLSRTDPGRHLPARGL